MQNVHQVIHKWPFTAFTILHAECSSDAYKTDEHSTWRMFIRCTLTCAILQMLSHLKSGKQRNGYRSIHTSVKSLKSWNSNAFIFSAQKSRQNLNELNCVRILARTAKLNAASNSRKTIDVIVFRVLPVYYLIRIVCDTIGHHLKPGPVLVSSQLPAVHVQVYKFSSHRLLT